LDSWITESLPDAVAYASMLLGNREQGEDVVHDCICKLLRAKDRYDLGQDGRKLLFRSISNACKSLGTRKRIQASLDAQGNYSANGKVNIVPSNNPSPAELAMTEELRNAVIQGLQQMKQPYNAVLQLASIGNTPSQIAESLELEPHHVRLLLSRSRKMMAAWLNDRFSE